MISALLKVTSVIEADQLLFGQPACFAVGFGGGGGVKHAQRFPFLISVAGNVCEALGFTGTLFCPGAAVPPGLVQSVVALPLVFTVMVTSALPRPARQKQVFNCVPKSVKVGVLPSLK